MKRLDILVHHDRIGKVSDCLHENDIGGLTFMTSKVEVAQNMNQSMLVQV